MKNSINQLCLGLWLAMGVALGIIGRSWENFFGLACVAVFFGIGFWASAARKAKRESGAKSGLADTVSILYVLSLSCVVVASLLFTLERVYLVNGDGYPKFLASGDLGSVEETGLFGAADAVCRNGVMSEIYIKPNNRALIRCGMFWYQGKTYTASVIGGKS